MKVHSAFGISREVSLTYTVFGCHAKNAVFRITNLVDLVRNVRWLVIISYFESKYLDISVNMNYVCYCKAVYLREYSELFEGNFLVAIGQLL
jgi:uncharacterized membrane protein